MKEQEMKRLNENGIRKLAKYLNESNIVSGSEWILYKDNDGVVVEHSGLTGDVFAKMAKHGVYFSEDKNGKYAVLVEEDVGNTVAVGSTDTVKSVADVGKKDSAESDSGIDINDQDFLEKLAEKLAPVLNKHFPNKEQVNTALDELADLNIDSKEWATLFKQLSMKIKRGKIGAMT